MQMQSMHNHNCLLLLHEEEDLLIEEVPAEVVRQASQDLGEKNAMGRNVDYAKLTGCHQGCFKVTIIPSAQDGLEEMLKISG